jgi:hypothetical protein
MEPVGLHQDPPPAAQLPKSQRLLRALPAPFLKVANSSFLSATSASLSPNLGSPAGKKKRKSTNSARNDSPSPSMPRSSATVEPPPSKAHLRNDSIMLMDQQNMPNGSTLSLARKQERKPSPLKDSPESSSTSLTHGRSVSLPAQATPEKEASDEFGREYDERLTLSIWAFATTNANPAVDLLVCLERTQTIGFRYVDITRAVVIHHGGKDTRVPLDNVKWLGSSMRRCEVRVLEGEGHGLMANAVVIGSVLTEMAREWDDWVKVVSKGRGGG